MSPFNITHWAVFRITAVRECAYGKIKITPDFNPIAPHRSDIYLVGRASGIVVALNCAPQIENSCQTFQDRWSRKRVAEEFPILFRYIVMFPWLDRKHVDFPDFLSPAAPNSDSATVEIRGAYHTLSNPVSSPAVNPPTRTPPAPGGRRPGCCSASPPGPSAQPRRGSHRRPPAPTGASRRRSS